MTGNIFRGLDVVQNSSPNLTVKVNPGSGMIREGTFPGDIAYHVALDTSGGDSVSLSGLPDPSNARNIYIVGYVDKAATPSGTNNTNVYKLIAVGGTPSGTPADPTTTQIQASAVGATNPYDIYARVRLEAAATQATTAKIDDLRSLTVPRIADKGITPAKWTNPYRFSAYRSSTFSSASSSPTVINFNAESYDINNNFDIATNVGRYTVPVNGTYHFDTRVGTTAANGSTTRIYLALYVNGSEVRRGLDTTVGTGNFMSANLSCDVQLTAAQYVEIYLFTTVVSGLQGSSMETYFNGFLVSQT